MNKKKCKRITFITIANMVAILLVVCGTAVHRPPSVSTLYRGTFTSTYKATGKAEAFRDSYQASGAASAVSTVTDVAAEGDWPMAAANPQRTSWTPEEVRGRLNPIWYKTIEPYISPKVQIIAANDLLYISTARGLYALDAETGDEVWVYPTELPLGHSPTIENNVAYVGGLDKKIHAIDALTGQGLWTFDEAEAGFQTNPLVINDVVYMGSRDGYMYAVAAHGTPNQGQRMWRFKTDGPILFSAAYKDGVVYFASNDSHAYALNAQTGELVWKSAKLPGAGFHSWWPVVYQDPASGVDVVILAGSNNYRHILSPAYGHDLQGKELEDVYDGIPSGETIAPISEEGLMDATRILEYYEEKPWRRTYFVLDAGTGEEFTFDYQRQDGTTGRSYAPILWLGTHSGNRYPPVVGFDNVLYQPIHYISNPYIAHGSIVGWEPGSSFVRIAGTHTNAMDEPIAYSMGGNLVYWNRCNDRVGAAFDVMMPDTKWTYFSYNLHDLIPGYNSLYEGVTLFWGPNNSHNGVYSQHGDQNPPIPYQGKVYMHRSNSVIAFGDYQGQPSSLPMWETVEVQDIVSPLSINELKQKLAVEVQKILDAGHLRPGYKSVGLFDWLTRSQCGDGLIDYWHYPSDTLYALSLAAPYLSETQQQDVETYLASEYTNYPPYQYTHIGWRDGAAREPFDLPDEVEADRPNHGPTGAVYGFEGWGTYYGRTGYPPHMFYHLWKYAEVFGAAQQIFDNSKSRLGSPPSDSYLSDYPYVHNAYIAGYLGYLALEELAGYPESASIRTELDRLLNLRATSFSNTKDTPFTGGDQNRALSVARNFMFLVPELGQYLHDNALADVQQAFEEYNKVAPYWFVTHYEATTGEGTIQHLYDHHALFQAKALILKEYREELTKYLDVPAVEVGDLFYIQNLVAAIEAPHYLEKTATPISGNLGTIITYTLSFFGDGSTRILTDTLPVGLSAPGNFELAGTSVTPTYDGGQHRLTWSDTPTTGQEVIIGYTVTITTSDPQVLVNTAEQGEVGGDTSTATATVIANPYLAYLPLVLKDN